MKAKKIKGLGLLLLAALQFVLSAQSLSAQYRLFNLKEELLLKEPKGSFRVYVYAGAYRLRYPDPPARDYPLFQLEFVQHKKVVDVFSWEYEYKKGYLYRSVMHSEFIPGKGRQESKQCDSLLLHSEQWEALKEYCLQQKEKWPIAGYCAHVSDYSAVLEIRAGQEKNSPILLYSYYGPCISTEFPEIFILLQQKLDTFFDEQKSNTKK